jgi:hypothetical protein
MRLRGAIATAAVAVAAVTAVPSAAHASSAQCHAGKICVWEAANYAGGFREFSGSVSTFKGLTYDNGHSVNDTVSSLWNRTSSTVYFYPAANYSGGYDLSETPGGGRQNLKVDSQNCGTSASCQFNDVFSSVLKP